MKKKKQSKQKKISKTVLVFEGEEFELKTKEQWAQVSKTKEP